MPMLRKFGTTVALAFAIGVAGCNKQSDNAAQTQEQQDPGYDPASANMAPADQSVPVNESATSAAPRSAVPASVASSPSQAAAGSSENVPPPPPDASESSYPPDDTVPATEVSSDQSGYYDTAAMEQPVYAPQPPPPLPVYEQPVCPGPNYLWTPGYWGYQPAGYFWVPGVWVIAPYIGALWTPGYWGWMNNRYGWNHGYWGPHVGYYGGINYGHGYVGSGYYGGYWNHNNFYYNRSITNVNTTVVRNVYVHNVTINNYNNNRVSYAGGHGGIEARPTPAELQASRERHLPPLTAQTMHARQAGQDRAQFFNVNHGKPQTVAVNRPLATPFHAPAAQPPVRGVANPGLAERAAAIHPVNRTAAPQQQRPEVRPNVANEARQGGANVARTQPQPPNLIRPQAHPENAVQHPQPRPTDVRPQPIQQPRTPQSEPTRALQPVHPAPRQEAVQRPQQEQPRPVVQPRPQQETRPTPQQRPQQEQQRPVVQPRPQQEIRPTPQQRPQQEQRPVVQHEQPRAPQEMHSAPHPQPQQRPESRPQEQPHEDHPHPR